VLVQNANPQAGSIEEYATTVKDYIRERLPADADLISLIFEDIEIYHYLRKLGSD
jgi:hypothetical protein